MTEKSIAIGVDVGGSHVSCAAFDLSENKYLEHTHAENDLDNMLEPAKPQKFDFTDANSFRKDLADFISQLEEM